jgi:hypothetical protein
MDLRGKRGPGNQGYAAGGAGEDVVLAGQAQIIGLPGEEHWPLHGGLVVGGPSTRQDSAFGMSIEAKAAYHLLAALRHMGEVAANEFRVGHGELGGGPRLMVIIAVGDVSFGDLQDLGILQRPPAHIAGEVLHHPFPMEIAGAHPHVPFEPFKLLQQPLQPGGGSSSGRRSSPALARNTNSGSARASPDTALRTRTF